MTGAIQGLTATYKFNLINFDYLRWHTYEQQNWINLDGVLSALAGGVAIRGVWQNNTQYAINDRVVDNSTNPSLIYICLVPHTSALTPTTFLQDRIANPTYWQQVQYSSVIGTGYGLVGGPVNGSGTISVDQTQLPLTGRRNIIFNPNGFVNQRAGGNVAMQLNNATAIYTADRWAAASSNPMAGVYFISAIAPYASCNSVLRIAKPAGNSGAAQVTLAQVITSSDVLSIAGKRITVSFLARPGSGYDAGLITCNITGGTLADEGLSKLFGGQWAGQTILGSLLLVPTDSTTFVRYSTQITVPSNIREVGITFTETFGSGTSAQNNFIDIREVQVEVGSYDTAHIVPEYITYEEELARCSVFYNQITLRYAGISRGVGNEVVPITFPKMGAPPSTTVVSSGISGGIGSTVFEVYGQASGGYVVNVNVAAGSLFDTGRMVYALSAEL